MSRLIARSPASTEKRTSCRLELVGVTDVTRRASELERLRVVMREELRVIGEAPLRLPLDPLGGLDVLLAARGARDLLVGDIADQHMPERELLLVAHRRDSRGSDELAAHELTQARENVVTVTSSHRGERTRPEHLPENGRVLEQVLELGRQRVEASRDQRLDGLRQVSAEVAPDSPSMRTNCSA